MSWSLANSSGEANLRVLVVDDSPINQRILSSVLAREPGVEVVGRAGDGREALQLAGTLQPDLITLDLEMPEMDGFAFLRILMATRPCPVLIVSGYAARENVFRALELGAIDFISSSADIFGSDLKRISGEISEKLALVRRLRQIDKIARHGVAQARSRGGDAHLSAREPNEIVAIGASTGGPQTVQRVLETMPLDLNVPIVVAIHMPAQFTTTYAARIDGASGLRVLEAEDGMKLQRGVAYIAPGGLHMEVVARPEGGHGLRTFLPTRADGAVACPSVDILFRSVAATHRQRCIGVVLTGMGADGTQGARSIWEAGGRVVAQDPVGALMPSMPRSVIESGVEHEVAAVDEVGARIRALLDLMQAHLS